MAQTEEKELVLGNKQLISLFFVAVLLCAVFFAMGYMIGRNSAKTTLAAVATDSSVAVAAGQRRQPDVPREEAQPEPINARESAKENPSAAAADKADDKQPEKSSAESDKPADAQPPRPAAPKQYSKEAASKPGAVPLEKLESGASYIQAIATASRSDAENIVRSLREKDFKALLTPGAKEGMFRVVVGPFRQTSQLSEAKQQLLQLGFGGAFVVKPN